MTTIAERGRWHWWIPRSWRTPAKSILLVVALLASTLALCALGYWLLLNGSRPTSIFALLGCVTPLYLAMFWLLVTDHNRRELVDKAVDDADRALATVAQLTAHLVGAPTSDDAPTGRHHRSQP